MECLQFTNGFEEVIVPADAPAAVFEEDAGHGTCCGPFAGVGGVEGQAGAQDARQVAALVFLVGARSGIGNVEEGVAVEAVAHGHGRVFPDGMEETDGVTDGLLFKVVPFLPDGVGVVAEAEVGIVDARVDEGQVEVGGLAGDETLQGERVAPTEEVALHDAAGHAELGEGGVAHAAHERAGAVFLEIDAQVHLVFLVGRHDGGVGLREVAQAVQAFVGAAQLGAVELIAVGKAQFTENNVVAGAGVALRDHAADMDLLFFGGHEEDVDGAVFLMLGRVEVHFRESIAVVAVEVGQGLDVVLNDGQREIAVVLLVLVGLDDLEQALVAVDEIALEADLAELVAFAFVDGEGDGDAVLRIVDLGRGHLYVDVTVIHGVGGDGGGVAFQIFLAQDARAGDPREDAVLLQSEFFLEIARVYALKALELDFLDVELLAFLDVEDEDGGGAVGPGFDAVVHLREVEAFLAVEFGDALDVLGKQAVVEDRARFRAHGREDVVFFHFIGAVDDDVVDAGLFLDVKDEDAAPAALLDVRGDVAEVAEVPDTLDFFIEGRGIDHVALAGGQAHQHHVGVKDLEAAYLDGGDRVPFDGRAAHVFDQLVHGGEQLNEVRLLREIGLRALFAGGVHHAGVDAEGVAGLVEAAVDGVVRACLPGHGTRRRQIELADLLLAEQAQRVLGRHDLEAARREALREERGQLVVQRIDVRPSADLEGEDGHADVLLPGGGGLSHADVEQVTERQRQQREYAFLHTVLQSVIRGSAQGFRPFPGCG